MVFRVCGVRQNICVQSLPQPWSGWPDFCLFTNMNGCRADWGGACLFTVCEWFEWPSSGVVGFFNHKSSWSCSFDLSTRPMHVMTDVPYLVRVAVVATRSNSFHSSLSAVISMAQAVLNLCVSRKVVLKQQVIWSTVCGAIQDLP